MKRKENKEKNPLLSFSMVIFPAHILAVAMRTSSWGTAETGVRQQGMGEIRKSGDRRRKGGKMEVEETKED